MCLQELTNTLAEHDGNPLTALTVLPSSLAFQALRETQSAPKTRSQTWQNETLFSFVSSGEAKPWGSPSQKPLSR